MFILIFSLSIILSFLLVALIRKISYKLKILDFPDIPRKIHKIPVPLLGGIGIYLCFLIFGFLVKKNSVFFSIVLSGLILHINGFLDDKYKLTPKKQLIGVILASLVPILIGIKIKFITNPLYFFGISNSQTIILPDIFKIILTFLWILILTYSTKLLDGLDGLVSGISTIGYLIIFLVSLIYNYELIALYALILAGANIGFLFWNFYPAKIFLGEGGSTFAGFSLAVLSISGTAKISITLLVLGLPILDLLAVMISRIKSHQSIFKGDNRHFHFKLLKLGLSERKSVVLYWICAIALGILGISLNDKLRIFLLLIIIIAFSLIYRCIKK